MSERDILEFYTNNHDEVEDMWTKYCLVFNMDVMNQELFVEFIVKLVMLRVNDE